MKCPPMQYSVVSKKENTRLYLWKLSIILGAKDICLPLVNARILYTYATKLYIQDIIVTFSNHKHICKGIFGQIRIKQPTMVVSQRKWNFYSFFFKRMETLYFLYFFNVEIFFILKFFCNLLQIASVLCFGFMAVRHGGS